MCLEIGKRAHQSALVGQPTGVSQSSALLFVKDEYTKRSFLIDTGAEISAVPKDFLVNPKVNEALDLCAVNGSLIHTYGEVSLSLQLGFSKPLRWVFTVTDISVPIIGADFLRHFGLAVDLQGRKLHDVRNEHYVSAIHLTGSA